MDFTIQTTDSNGDTTCMGAVFDLGNNNPSQSGAPEWIVGDTFLVSVVFLSPMQLDTRHVTLP